MAATPRNRSGQRIIYNATCQGALPASRPIMGRTGRISPARADTLRVAEVSTPKVSLSAHRHSAGRPPVLGAQAASPPSGPALVVTAPGSRLVNVAMKLPADEPDRFPPINRMICGPDAAAVPPPSSQTAEITFLA